MFKKGHVATDFRQHFLKEARNVVLVVLTLGLILLQYLFYTSGNLSSVQFSKNICISQYKCKCHIAPWS